MLWPVKWWSLNLGVAELGSDCFFLPSGRLQICHNVRGGAERELLKRLVKARPTDTIRTAGKLPYASKKCRQFCEKSEHVRDIADIKVPPRGPHSTLLDPKGNEESRSYQEQSRDLLLAKISGIVI